MSAILETEPGGELVCIMSFSAMPKDATAGSKRRSFRIGERVRYVGYYQDTNLADNPAGWMVLFESNEPKGPRRFAATQTYFVTTESWKGLRKYIADELRHQSLVKSKAAQSGPKKNTPKGVVKKPIPQHSKKVFK